MVAIVGGGAAGLVCAVQLARAGVKTVVFEKKDRVGKKLLATGNGRCNISNADMDLSHYHGTHADFAKSIIATDTAAFWRSVGLELCELEKGRIYPMSLQASAVVDALRFACERLGVEIRTNETVQNLQALCNRYDDVVLAVGGKAGRQYGSDGDGFTFAKELGLKTQPLRPAIVRLTCDHPYLKELSGAKVNAKVRCLDADGTVLEEREGEVLFTEEGLSGPPVLDLARMALTPKKKTALSLNLVPSLSKDELEHMLQERVERFGDYEIGLMLSGLLNKRLIGPICKTLGIRPTDKAAALPIVKAVTLLTGWTFPVTGSADWKEAQVTVGGIDTTQLDPATMAFKKRPHLYAVGEVLDIDGDCGGYNLHFACATALIAARALGGNP